MSTLNLISIMDHLVFMVISVKEKTSEMVTFIYVIKNIFFLAPMFFIFLLCIVISKVIGFSKSERYWDDLKTIKPGKISAISISVSEKQSIVYTSTSIESARIEYYHSDKNVNDPCLSHTWNEDDDDFYQQL